jgi:arabinogalactan oligomer/maltooligosaccharide transport system substrate-binding protein
MNKIPRLFLILIVPVIFSLISASAASSYAAEKGKKEIVLSFMNTMNDEENETLFELVKEYGAKNPDVKIQIENVSFYDAKNFLEEKFKQKSLPDIMRVEIRLILPYARQKMFAALDSLVSTSDYVDYFPYLYKFSVLNAKELYGIPQVTDCLVLLYNKSHFASAKIDGAPKNMADFLAAARKLTVDEDGNSAESTLFNQFKISRYGFSYHFESYYLLPFIFSFGGNLCDEAGAPLIKSEKTKSALKFIYELKSKHNAVPAKIDPKFGHDFTLMEFMDGRVSMIIDGPWNIKKILKGSAFKNASNLGVAVVPRSQNSASPIGGQYLCISSACKYPKEAYDFMNFINSKEAQLKFARLNYIIPTRKSAMEQIQSDLAEPDFSIRKALFEQMKLAALHVYNIPEPAYLDELNKALEKLLSGQTGFDETLDGLDKKFEAMAKEPK